MNDTIFSQIDFGPLKEFLDLDDITDISYSNGGQVWLKSLSKGVYRVERPEINNALIEKLAFQCSNVMGKTFNMAHPFLDAESAELRLNFVHDSIARNGIAVVIRKTPAKIRLEKEKILAEKSPVWSLQAYKYLHGANKTAHREIVMEKGSLELREHLLEYESELERHKKADGEAE